MRSKIFLIILLAAHCSLIKGQIVGDDVKRITKQKQRDKFNSQVVVETLVRWRLQDEYLEYMMEELIEKGDSTATIPYKFYPRGGGTILSGKWVLTCAHIFYLLEETETEMDGMGAWYWESVVDAVRVVVGQVDLYPRDASTRPVERVVVHHDFDESHVTMADVALLQLTNPLVFTRDVRFGVMSLPPVKEYVGMRCRMSGWGKNNQGSNSEELQWARAEVVRGNDRTRRMTSGTDLFPVAGRVGYYPRKGTLRRVRASTAEGDSGGGLLCQHEGRIHVFGVSHKILTKENGTEYPLHEYGTEELPALFISVHDNLQWINDQMGDERVRDGELVSKSYRPFLGVFDSNFDGWSNDYGDEL